MEQIKYKSINSVDTRLIIKESLLYESKLTNFETVSDFFKSQLDDRDREVFAIIGTDSKGGAILYSELHIGDIKSAVVGMSTIFKPLILGNCAAFFIAHNHPSGDTTPSGSDLDVTKKIKKAAEVMGFDFFDSIIVSHTGKRSLRETSDIWR